MKKKMIFIYSCIIISVIFQLIMYAFVDKVYLRGRENIAATLKVTTEESIGNEVMVEEPETSIEIPANAKKLEVSLNGKYIAYVMDRKLYIVEVDTKEVKEVVDNYFVTTEDTQNKVEADITCFKWVSASNKNVIMYGLSSLKEAPGKAQIFTYDLDTQNEHVGVTFTESYVPKGGEITDLVISPLNMVCYVKIKINDTQERLFRTDLMDQMFPSITIDSGRNTKIGYFSEDLVYEDGSGRLYVKSGFKSPYQIQSDGNAVLLGVIGVQKDGKDRVYAGLLNEQNKVDKILFGHQGLDVAQWQSINMDNALNQQDIIIRQEEIYSIDREDGIVFNIQKGRKINFKGDFLDIVNNHIAYIDANVLKFKPLDKK